METIDYMDVKIHAVPLRGHRAVMDNMEGAIAINRIISYSDVLELSILSYNNDHDVRDPWTTDNMMECIQNDFNEDKVEKLVDYLWDYTDKCSNMVDLALRTKNIKGDIVEIQMITPDLVAVYCET